MIKESIASINRKAWQYRARARKEAECPRAQLEAERLERLEKFRDLIPYYEEIIKTIPADKGRSATPATQGGVEINYGPRNRQAA